MQSWPRAIDGAGEGGGVGADGGRGVDGDAGVGDEVGVVVVGDGVDDGVVVAAGAGM
jgi:hypothetical protein